MHWSSGVVRKNRTTLIIVLLMAALAAVVGAGVEDRLSPAAGFRDPQAESTLADAFLEENFAAGASNLVLLVERDDAGPISIDTESGHELTTRVAETEGVLSVVSIWTTGVDPSLVASDGRSTLVLARLLGDEDEVDEAFVRVRTKLESDPIEGLTIGFAGEAASSHAAVAQSEADLARAELVAAPLVLIVLLIVFRSVAASLLPLFIGIVSILGTLAILRLATLFGPVSIFSLNLTTALGFGLAVDYSLLFVSRYRAEVRSGAEDPIAVTRRTAGRSIAFSALTTAASIAVLAVFPLGFLRSMAIAGPAVVVLSGALSLIVLPAALAILGPNLERWTLPGRAFNERSRRWERIGHSVRRRPLPVAIAAGIFLLVLGGPFLDVEWGLSDDRILAERSDVRSTFDRIRTDYVGAEFGPVTVVAPDRSQISEAQLSELVLDLSSLSDVDRVDSMLGPATDGTFVRPAAPVDAARYERSDAMWFSLVLAVEPGSDPARAVVNDLRDRNLPLLVGGLTARQMDTVSALTSRALSAIGLVFLLSFALLAKLSRSIVIPLKALLLNVLSLSATLGVIVFVFQQGNYAELINVTATGTVDLSIVVLIVLVAFGLSMDYEVFLVSRLREEYERTGNNDVAVVESLSRTASVITASAALVAIVFASFIVADIALVKMSGIGIALAVVVDAVVVRSTLAPALLFLAGDANWWWPFRHTDADPIDLRTADGVSLSSGESPTTPPQLSVPTEKSPA